MIEYVLLISCVSLAICIAGPPVADAIQGQFGHVSEVVKNGTTGSGGGGSDFPGEGTNPDKPGGGDEGPDKPGGGTDPDKPGGGGTDKPTDPEPQKEALKGTLSLDTLYVGRSGSVVAKDVSAGAQLAYKWMAEGKEIGASGTSWTPTDAYLGKTVSVSASDSSGKYTGQITSAGVVVRELKMSGTVSLSPVVVGKVATATVDGAPADAVPGYSWTVDGKEVASGSTWTPAAGYAGKEVKVSVVDTTGAYKGSIEAAATVRQMSLESLIELSSGTKNVPVGTACAITNATVSQVPSDADIILTWKIDGAVIASDVDSVTLPDDSEGKTLEVEGRDRNGIYGGVISVSLVIKADPRVAEAFAVYSADDQSLDFYKRKSVPKPGEVFEGKTVTEVYTGIETDEYSIAAPWLTHCTEIISSTVVDEIVPISTAKWYYLCSKLERLDIANLNTKNVVNMSKLFSGCSSLTSVNLTGWDSSKVTDMSWMFDGCESLEVLDVSSLDTSKVTDMSWMFDGCESLEVLDVSSLDTQSVEDFSYMFNRCSKLEQLDISNFNTSNAIDFHCFLADCKQLHYIDVSNLTTDKVKRLDNMFARCENLSGTIDMSNWNTNCVESNVAMFERVNKVSKITVGNGCKWAKRSSFPNTADGKWYNSKGQAFDLTEIPNNVADTYYASKDLLPKMTGSVEISDPVAGRDCRATVSGTPSDAVLSFTWYKSMSPDDYGWTEIAGDYGDALPGSEVVASEGKSGTKDARIVSPIGSEMYYKVAVSDASGKYQGSIESPGKKAEKPQPMTGKVTVTGTPTYGGMLTANVSGTPSDAVLTYQWKRDGAVIDGSTGQMRSISSADLGCDLVVEVGDASGKYSGTIKSGTVPAFKKVSWASGTDAEVARMVEAADAGYIKLTDYWKSGDVRNVQLSTMQDAHGLGDRHDAQTVELVLSDPGHFELADGRKCNFVVIQKDCLNVKGRMNSYNSNIGGWDVAPRRSWCNTTYREALPEGLRPAFKLFKVHTADGAGSNSYESLDYFTLASEVEMYGTAKYSDAAAEAANSQLEYYKEGKAVRKKANGQETWYWLRSSRATGGYAYCVVNASAGADYNNANGTGGLAPFGCI